MPLSVSSNTRQLSDGNSQGTILGRATTDFIGFYGLSQGVVQPSGNAQAALTRGVTGGAMAIMATSQSPANGGVPPNSTLEGGVINNVATQTVTGAFFAIASSDILVVNKPTAQAGLGYGNVRLSAAGNAGVQFSNFTAATVTPTTAEKYGIVALRGVTGLTVTASPTAVGPASNAEQLFTCTGVRVGECVIVSKPTAQVGLDIVGVRVAANNQIGINFMNFTAATITPTASQGYTVFSTGGIDNVDNRVTFQANVVAPAVAAISTTTAQSITVTGLAATDAVIGVSKPTAQAGLSMGGAFVSGANALGVVWGATTVSVTPTSYEAYAVHVWRANPVAPCTVYSVALSPAGVAASTTAEQIFTVTGIVANSMVWVNKPTVQSGLAVCGVRAGSSANQLAITFGNNTATTITPTASETYVIANFAQALSDGGSSVLFNISPQVNSNVVLSNAIRTALAGTNLIAGA